MPKANPPAENVPKALLNPLLSVAPAHLSYNNLKLAIHIKETAKLIHKNEISGDPLVSAVGCYLNYLNFLYYWSGFDFINPLPNFPSLIPIFVFHFFS